VQQSHRNRKEVIVQLGEVPNGPKSAACQLVFSDRYPGHVDFRWCSGGEPILQRLSMEQILVLAPRIMQAAMDQLRHLEDLDLPKIVGSEEESC
jgi:hypothetical protein